VLPGSPKRDASLTRFKNAGPTCKSALLIFQLEKAGLNHLIVSELNYADMKRLRISFATGRSNLQVPEKASYLQANPIDIKYCDADSTNNIRLKEYDATYGNTSR
jgi:hypothetical protein